MRILFMGTPRYAAVVLQAVLEAGFTVIGVVTQPDRPKGRGLNLVASEVKEVACTHSLPVWQPEKVADPTFLKLFNELKPDLVVVVAFGQKIPGEILFTPQYGCINLHGSLLPEYRGAAPIQHALLNGDAETGVTTIYMDEGWDTGDIIMQAKALIDPDEDFGRLYERLARIGGGLLVETIKAIATGSASRLKQDNQLATFAPKLRPELALLDWNRPAAMLHNQVRAFSPNPGAETFFKGDRLKILETSLPGMGEFPQAEPGVVVGLPKGSGIAVATGSGALLLTRIQPPGKRLMNGSEFANGRRLTPGVSFVMME
jgi:methionyl-tRNA formyltransferase